MPPTDSQPQAVPPRRSRLKGCLIILLIPPLALGILYAYLLLTPTGYTDTADASRATRERILSPRLAPRKTESSPQTPEVPHSPIAPDSLDTPISPEEAQVWWETQQSLWRWSEISQENFRTELRPLSPDDLILNPGTNTPELGPAPREYMERKTQVANSDSVRRLLQFIARQAPSPENSNPPSDSPTSTTTQIGTLIVQDMNRIERFLLEERWEEAGIFDQIQNRKRAKDEVTVQDFRSQVLGENNRFYRVILRALRNNDPEKAARLIEQYIRLSGACLFTDVEWYGPFQLYRLATLEHLLSWIATDRRIPENVLEWTAATLASWKLEPQEYADLCAANRNQAHEFLISDIRELLAPQSESYRGSLTWHFFLDGRLEKTTQQAVAPILWRAIDRKAAALDNQDEAEYRNAHLLEIMALLAMNIRYDTGFSSDINNTETPTLSLYGDLLEKDGLQRIKGYRPERNGGNSPESDSQREKIETPFALMKFMRGAREEHFNRPIEMAQVVFATARYRREHGRFPDSIEAMIPRYLDASFAPNTERFWSIAQVQPSNLIVISYPKTPRSFTQILDAYAEDPRNEGRLPASLEGLKPYADPKTDLTPFAQYFVPFEEYPVLSLVVLKDEFLASSEEIQGFSEGETGKKKPVGATFQYLLFSFPPSPPAGLKKPEPTPPGEPARPPE